MSGRFIPPSEQYQDNFGNLLDSGKLFFFESGTVVAKNVFADPDGLIPLTSPVILDGSGRTPNIFLTGAYKLIIQDKNGQQIEERDPVLAADSTTTGFSVWNAITTYSVDDIVRASDNNLYISITNSNQNNEPAATATAWTKTQLLNSYNANQTYSIGDIAVDSVGDIYKSLTNSNIGNTPSTSPSDWDFSTIGTAGIIETVEANAVELGRDTPAAANVTTLDATDAINTDTINEATSAAGVMIDAVLAKDGEVIIDNNKVYKGKEVGETPVDLVQVNSSDQVQIGSVSSVTLFAGSSHIFQSAVSWTVNSTLNNNIVIQAKETGGAERELIQMNSSNVAQFGDLNNATLIKGTSYSLDGAGGTTIASLAGVGTRTVVVDSNGLLSAP